MSTGVGLALPPALPISSFVGTSRCERWTENFRWGVHRILPAFIANKIAYQPIDEQTVRILTLAAQMKPPTPEQISSEKSAEARRQRILERFNTFLSSLPDQEVEIVQKVFDRYLPADYMSGREVTEETIDWIQNNFVAIRDFQVFEDQLKQTYSTGVARAFASHPSIELYRHGVLPLDDIAREEIRRRCENEYTRVPNLYQIAFYDAIQPKAFSGDASILTTGDIPAGLQDDLQFIQHWEQVSSNIASAWKNHHVLGTGTFQNHDSVLTVEQSELLMVHASMQADYQKYLQAFAQKVQYIEWRENMLRELFLIMPMRAFDAKTFAEKIAPLGTQTFAGRYFHQVLQKANMLGVTPADILNTRFDELRTGLQDVTQRISSLTVSFQGQQVTLNDFRVHQSMQEAYLFAQSLKISGTSLLHELRDCRAIEMAPFLNVFAEYNKSLKVLGLMQQMQTAFAQNQLYDAANLVQEINAVLPAMAQAIGQLGDQQQQALGLPQLIAQEEQRFRQLQGNLIWVQNEAKQEMAYAKQIHRENAAPQEFHTILKDAIQHEIDALTPQFPAQPPLYPAISPQDQQLRQQQDEMRARVAALRGRLAYLQGIDQQVAQSVKNAPDWRAAPLQTARANPRTQAEQYFVMLDGDGVKRSEDATFIVLDLTKFDGDVNAVRNLLKPDVAKGFLGQRSSDDAIVWLNLNHGQLEVSDHNNGTIQIYCYKPKKFISQVEDRQPDDRNRLERVTNEDGTQFMVPRIKEQPLTGLKAWIHSFRNWSGHATQARVRSKEVSRMAGIALVKQAMEYVLQGRLHELNSNDIQHITEAIFSLEANRELEVQGYVNDPAFQQFKKLFLEHVESLVTPILIEKEVAADTRKLMQVDPATKLKMYSWEKDRERMERMIDMAISYKNFGTEFSRVERAVLGNPQARANFGLHIEKLRAMKLQLDLALAHVPPEFLQEPRPSTDALLPLWKEKRGDLVAADALLVQFYSAIAVVWLGLNGDLAELTAPVISKHLREQQNTGMQSLSGQDRGAFQGLYARSYQDAPKVELHLQDFVKATPVGPSLFALRDAYAGMKTVIVSANSERAKKLHAMRKAHNFDAAALTAHFYRAAAASA